MIIKKNVVCLLVLQLSVQLFKGYKGSGASNSSIEFERVLYSDSCLLTDSLV